MNNNFELDDLKREWSQMQTQFATTETTLNGLRLEHNRQKVESLAGRLRREPIFELVVSAMTLLFSGNFLADHWREIQTQPLGAVPALLLYPIGIFTIATAVRQLILIADLNPENGIVHHQNCVAQIGKLRGRTTQILLLSLIPIWFIFPILLGQAVLNFNFYKAVSGTWIASNLVFGLLLVGIVVVASQRLGESSRFVAGLQAILAGDEVRRAETALAEGEEFLGG